MSNKDGRLANGSPCSLSFSIYSKPPFWNEGGFDKSSNTNTFVVGVGTGTRESTTATQPSLPELSTLIQLPLEACCSKTPYHFPTRCLAESHGKKKGNSGSTRPVTHHEQLSQPSKSRNWKWPPHEAKLKAYTICMDSNRHRKTFKIKMGKNARTVLGQQETKNDESLKTRSSHVNKQTAGATMSIKHNNLYSYGN